MDNLELSVVIPAYLEAENLKELLPRINNIFRTMSVEYEVLVLDTILPRDNAMTVCVDNGAHCINRENGNDYGDAVRTGIRHAKGHYIIFMDADGSHSPEFIRNLYDSRDGFDVVIASRYVEGGNTENNKLSIFMSMIVNIVYSKFLHLKCHDVSNSFKLYDAGMLK